ncbi:thrombospondin [Micromonospora sp. NBC_01699]|uniref:thrombospondin n=1 Tax=Micromonospora sp. NBC_01699 TaxID=2975984 RepID=UPI002E2BD94A|nr:thrombospondin [Micromonospora sp. NBC_01699]
MVRIPSLSRRAEKAPETVTVPTRDNNGDGRIDERDATPVAATTPVARSTDTAPPRTDRAVAHSDAVLPASERARTGDVTPASERATYRSSTAGPATAAAPVLDRSRGTDTATDTRPLGGPARTDGRPLGDATRTDGRPVRDGLDRSDHRTDDRTDDRTGHPIDDRTDDRTDTIDERADREPPVVVPAGPRPRASLLATLSLVLGVAAALFVLTGTLAGYGIAVGTLGALLGVAGISATSRRHVAGKSDALLGLGLGLTAVVIGILAMTGQFTWPTTDGDWVLRFREWLDAQFVDRF